MTCTFGMTSLMTLNQHKNSVIIFSFKIKTMGTLKYIKRGSRLSMMSSLPGLALRTHVESLGKPRDVNKRSQSLVRYT